MQVFGYDFKKKDVPAVELNTFNLDKETTSERVIPDYYYRPEGGAITIPYEFAQVPAEELELIRSYREIAMAAEVDEALQEIRNEVFIFDVPQKKAFEIDFFAEAEIKDSIKRVVQNEFDYLYNLIDFDTFGIQWFDDWYVDGKLYLYKIIDEKAPKKGILKVQTIDPLKIRKIRVIPKPDQNGIYDINEVKEFYVYNSFDPRLYPLNQVIQLQYGTNIQGLQIRPDCITYVHSGLFDRNMGRYVGYLRKAIIPYNNLKMMEDAMVIFRVVRAPSRRAFYVDVSGLQKNKAEAYIKELMAKFKNKMVYDSTKGTLSDRRNVQTMIEDYWLPRRDGQKGTEVSTIEGQSNQEIIEELEYLRDKLWRALGVPRGRFGDQPSTFQFGKGIEIQRDEYRFKKFIDTLRSRFVPFMEDLLKTQLILKRVIREDEWQDIKSSINWVYTEDNAFVEYKESEIINNRLTTLASIEPHIGKYYSRDWVFKNVLRMTDEEIAEQKKQIEAEKPDELQRQKDEYDVQNPSADI